MLNELLDNYYGKETEEKILDLSRNTVLRGQVFYSFEKTDLLGHGMSLGYYLTTLESSNETDLKVSEEDFLNWAFSEKVMQQVANYFIDQIHKEPATYLFMNPDLKSRIKNIRQEKNLDALLKTCHESVQYEKYTEDFRVKIALVSYQKAIWTDCFIDFNQFNNNLNLACCLLNIKAKSKFIETIEVPRIKNEYLRQIIFTKFNKTSPCLTESEIEIFKSMIDMPDFKQVLNAWNEITISHPELK